MKLLTLPGKRPTATRADIVQLYESWNKDSADTMGTSFTEYVNSGFKSTGVVFACILVRMQLVSQGRFYWRDYSTGERLPDDQAQAGLSILRRPWPNGTTGDLLARMELDASIAGNAFIHRGRRPDGGFQLQRLRPDWVRVITDPQGRQVAGYIYAPGGEVGPDSVVINVEDMAHYAPLPDPLHPFIGMSWMTPVARSINNVVDMSAFQSKFFTNAATPNMLITVAGKLGDEQQKRLRNQINRRYAGIDNAYRTLLLEGGADATIIGKDLREVQFTMTKAAAENEVASASGVPAILAGLKEGLQAATYSNAAQARRVFAMGTGRFLLQNSGEALATILPSKPRETVELWYDETRISWFNEDATETATINQTKASTIETLIRSGYDPNDVVAAVDSGDFSKLKHSGLVSVQLQPPGTETEPEPEPASNGNGQIDADALEEMNL